MTDLATLVVRLEAQTAQYQAQLTKATSSITSFERTINKSVANIAGSFVSMAAAVAGPAAIGLLIKSTLEYGEQLTHLSDETGVSVERLSSLALAAKQSGLDIDSLARSMKVLGVAISTAAGKPVSEQAIAFKLLGVNVKDSSGHIKDANAVMLESADSFGKLEDGPNKVALAVALFGRQGAALIPMLDKGSAGINEMSDALARAGGVMSTQSAHAAEEFNDKIDLLTTSLKVGLGAQLVDGILPLLNQFTDKTQDSLSNTASLSSGVNVLTAALKSLLIAADGVVTGLDTLGKFEGASFAAINQLLQGNFKETKDIMVDFGHDAGVAIGQFADTATKAFTNTNDGLSEIQLTVKKWKVPAQNLSSHVASIDALKKASEAAAAAAQRAVQQLQTMQAQLSEQIETFGMTDAAATKYSLTLGSLADEVAKGGAKAKSFADAIIAEADALQKLKDTKDIADGLAAINAQIDAFKGDVIGAALTGFDQSYKDFLKTATRAGDQAALERVGQLRELTVAQAQYNALQQEAERIQDDLAAQEQRIQTNQILGTTTELDGLEQLSAAREQAVAQLEKIDDQMHAIAVTASNPAILKGAQQLATGIDALAAQTHLLAQRIRGDFVDAAAESFSAFISGSQNAEQAVLSFVRNITQALIDLVSKHLAEQIFAGMGGTGGGGGVFGALASLFGSGATAAAGGGGGLTEFGPGDLSALISGPRAAGGPVAAGSTYLVGEKGPELFTPDQSGSITAHDAGVVPMYGLADVHQFSFEASDAHSVGDYSMEDPWEYFADNAAAYLALLLEDHAVKRFGGASRGNIRRQMDALFGEEPVWEDFPYHRSRGSAVSEYFAENLPVEEDSIRQFYESYLRPLLDTKRL